MLLVNNDIKDVVELVNFRSEQKEKMQQIEDRQQEIYRENSSRKRKIKTDEQYREYQIWHVEVQEELDELKQEKREIKRQIQLADGIVKEDLYTAYYAVSENEEIVADREIEIPGMEEDMLVERTTEVVVEVMNQPANSHNEELGQKKQTDITDKSEYVEIKKWGLWIKLSGLSGEYQSLVVMRTSVILLRQTYSDLILPMYAVA